MLLVATECCNWRCGNGWGCKQGGQRQALPLHTENSYSGRAARDDGQAKVCVPTKSAGIRGRRKRDCDSYDMLACGVLLRQLICVVYSNRMDKNEPAFFPRAPSGRRRGYPLFHFGSFSKAIQNAVFYYSFWVRLAAGPDSAICAQVLVYSCHFIPIRVKI